MRLKWFFLTSLFFAIPAYADTTPPAFTATSTAFLDKGVLPQLYTCDGKNISPEVAWTNPPGKTQTFAIVLSDPDAPKGTFYHWILYNIPAKTAEIPEDLTQPPTGVSIGINDFHKTGYNGPCPPKDTTHSYLITLYALDNQITPANDMNGKKILAAIKGHVIQSTVLTAVFSRWPT